LIEIKEFTGVIKNLNFTLGLGVFLDVFFVKISKNVRGESIDFLKKNSKIFFIAYSVLKPFKTLKSALVLKIIFSTSP
jgi:hypothetical protein